MPKVYRMIDRAISSFSKGRMSEAMTIIMDALSMDPGNLGVWDTYISFLGTRYDCELAKQKVLQTQSLNVPDEFGWMIHQQYLLRRIETRESELQRLEPNY
jgi:hypothetical protein